ncbi:Gfo/Idh/MocA family oxidoreductase [Herbiconiux sp. KACC 21604]|uniref:Gfo/Idh/MocA family protein n=1 Tax=unclassified Herbiconiux TaxID=2618217 RepID=UPI0014927FC3|nr:Gfo/Idh/MocA family oxidoreductase [Herbiconiux sp. SALV-R1]QJU55105.1 Gfo/Idh/MocA family oxidoreductase [Herbiconiux sp. SALV-R1]WPO86253.1 Gfo/Idh/MocA family oxidoreductase [Herbiconiux sp. KACC 21604]
MIRVGLVGCGWWAAHAHVPAIDAHPDAALVAASDPDRERLATVTAGSPQARGFATVEEMLAVSDLDVMVVASPAAFHAGAARAGLLSDVSVLVEKPFTLRASDAHELVRLATSRRLGLSVSLPYQYTAAARTLRTLLAEGTIGDLVGVHAVFESYAAPLYTGDVDEYLRRVNRPHALAPLPGTYADAAVAGGGHGQSQTSHVVSAILDATGAMPERIAAESVFVSPGMDTANAISLRLSGTAVATVFSSGGALPGLPAQQTVTYLGTAGSARHDLAGATLDWATPDGAGGHVEPGAGESDYPNGAPVSTLIDAVARVRAGHSDEQLMQLTAGAERAARAVEVIERLYREDAGRD